jgi:hypothetical protein
VELPVAPPYEALSYVWGSGGVSQGSLRIDDCSVEVRKGLFDALQALRHPDRERLVWVDAISIDQANMEERGHQVLMMDKIYRTAANVVVYLGQPTARTEDGMRAMGYFARPNRKSPPWSHMASVDVERGFADILNRPWFTRVWTVQEATLARKVTLKSGSYEMSWTTDLRTIRTIVFRIKSAILSPAFITHDGIKSLNWTPLVNVLETQMRQAALRENTVLRRNHLDLLYDFKDRRCADPRDRYFGMFGIIEHEQGGPLNLNPDYFEPLERVHARYIKEIQHLIDDDPTIATINKSVLRQL